ncbi:hypothetical protein [Rhizobium laguerreae]|uniref:hypothetical protein n=1 Tax=Rhizobium laguerreae TaxID=1076926 RepID=UPI001FEEA3C7|nr:hypothetical protein [Rhizobium laguerreae]
MASPWKLLARLVSPRRRQRQEYGSTIDVKPDLLAIANPTETAANDESDAIDRPADQKPVLQGYSSDRAEQAASSVDDTTDVKSSSLEKAADPAPSNGADIAAHVAQKALQIDKGAARKRSRQAKKAVDSQPSPRSSIVSDDVISLDGEISLLRDQLARKLRLQNAQLNRMLERFDS